MFVFVNVLKPRKPESFFSVCIHPGDLDNGDVLISEERLETRYMCHTGYNLIGPEIRDCQQDGQGWALDPPACGNYIMDGCYYHYVFHNGN